MDMVKKRKHPVQKSRKNHSTKKRSTTTTRKDTVHKHNLSDEIIRSKILAFRLKYKKEPKVALINPSWVFDLGTVYYPYADTQPLGRSLVLTNIYGSLLIQSPKVDVLEFF